MPRIEPLSTRHWQPNIWDGLVLIIVFGFLAILAWGASKMTAPFVITESIEISLEPWILPNYAIRTVLRMFIALFFSLLFTFSVAPIAARNPHFERFIIPFIDIMESIPILSFLAISLVFFIQLFPNSLLGPECAAIFVIFTSQVWNMTLSLYQSLKTIPKDLQYVADAFHLSKRQRFWKIEVPYSIPQLVWNTMISMSAGWFFVVASEAFSVNNQEITLPGIGSYIHIAILDANWPAIGYAIITMFIVILIYDQLLFRPILSWAEKFNSSKESYEESNSWFYNLLASTNLVKNINAVFKNIFNVVLHLPQRFGIYSSISLHWRLLFSRLILIAWNVLFICTTIFTGYMLGSIIINNINIKEFLHVIYLGFITACKVGILLLLASIVWIPIGVWIGLNNRARSFFQPLSQFLAAFPANLLFPPLTYLIVKYNLNINIWTTPLMILGSQWYILFNIIAGASSLPKDIQLAARNFNVTGLIWWRRIMLPTLFPYYITGAMAAAGGCWNASIVAEVIYWGEEKSTAIGLGAYITTNFSIGDYPRVALGTAIMCLYVMVINRLIWHKLYHLAESRFALE